jgi:phospholipase/carboxylesterase
LTALTSLAYLTREPEGDPDGALVLLHGRGADERDLYPVLDLLDPQRRLLGVTLRAPLSMPPGGAHWYALGGIPTPEPTTFHSSLDRASGWLDAFAKETGIAPEQTILGGFSQGAVMSYALGLGEGRPLPAALVAFSGFVPVVEGFELDLDRPFPPIAIGHGTLDDVIPVQFGRQAKELLERAGGDVRYRESPMGHSIDPRFAAELAADLLPAALTG